MICPLVPSSITSLVLLFISPPVTPLLLHWLLYHFSYIPSQFTPQGLYIYCFIYLQHSLLSTLKSSQLTPSLLLGVLLLKYHLLNATFSDHQFLNCCLLTLDSLSLSPLFFSLQNTYHHLTYCIFVCRVLGIPLQEYKLQENKDFVYSVHCI